MRIVLILTFFALVGLCFSSPIDPQTQMETRLTRGQISRGTYSSPVKGHGVVYVKGGTPRDLQKSLRKGEYVCGGKICKLAPGQLPPGCEDHICQYPLPLKGAEDNFSDLISS